MLKRHYTGRLACFLWLACLCLPAPALARKGVTQGFVDLKVVLNEVCDGRRARKRLRYHKDRYQLKLNQLQIKLKQMRARYRKKSMPADARKKLRHKMQVGVVRLQGAYKQLSKHLKHLEARETHKILTKSRRLIRKLAEKHKLVFVFEKGQSSLLYARKDRDFTKALIRLYHSTFCQGTKGAEAKPPSNTPGSKKLKLRLKELGIDTQ